MTELKPCPFCGGEAEIVPYESKVYKDCVLIECLCCDKSSDIYTTEAKAIEAWNTRQQPDLSTVEAIDSAIDAKFAEIVKLVELKWQIKSNEEAGE